MGASLAPKIFWPGVVSSRWRDDFRKARLNAHAARNDCLSPATQPTNSVVLPEPTFGFHHA